MVLCHMNLQYSRKNARIQILGHHRV
jgi:hypothetical protein